MDSANVSLKPKVQHNITRSHKAKALRQALQMQDVLHAVVLSDETKPLERASCARAWTDLEERKRILRGKPLPGQLQPDRVPKRRSSRRVIGLATPEQVAAQVASEGAA